MEFTSWYKKQAEACCRGIATRFSAFFLSATDFQSVVSDVLLLCPVILCDFVLVTGYQHLWNCVIPDKR
jgi:hypothetical protein